MKNCFRLFVLLATTFTTVHATTVQDVVAANYPPTLSARAAQHQYPDIKQQAFIAVTTPGGQYIVAAYSNSQIGAVLLLKLTSPGTYTVVDLAKETFIGRTPTVKGVDLDRDGVPEALVSFENGMAGASTWVYAVGSDKLDLLSPLDKQGFSNLAVPYVVDLGSGTLDLVDLEISGPRSGSVTATHYVLRNGRLVAVAPLDFFHTFYRETGTPVTDTATFDVAPGALPLPYQLVIVNGLPDGTAAVSSAEIRLNGVLLADQSNFSQNRRVITMPVSVQQHNTFAIRLTSDPGGRITVVVKHD